MKRESAPTLIDEGAEGAVKPVATFAIERALLKRSSGQGSVVLNLQESCNLHA